MVGADRCAAVLEQPSAEVASGGEFDFHQRNQPRRWRLMEISAFAWGTCMLIRAAREGAPPAASEHWLLDERVVIHPISFCPPLPRGTRYCLLKRDSGGARTVLGLGSALNSRPPLNLAYIRQRGTLLDANEVLVLEPTPPVLSLPVRQPASLKRRRGDSERAAGHGS